jgi:hypothetical protein
MQSVTSGLYDGVAKCEACQAGRLETFSVGHAERQSEADAQDPIGNARQALGSLTIWQPLRRGALYRCEVCGRPWHFEEQGGQMTNIPEDRVALVLRWSRGPIMLPATIRSELERIGRSPQVPLLSGLLYEQTPCAVVTTAGEPIEMAMVSIQRHAPFEPYRQSRLGSEIADVYPSPYALPLWVRIATSQAEEFRWGLFPTDIEMPDGATFTLDGQPEFLNRDGYRGSDAFLPVDGRPLGKEMPGAVQLSKDVVYFVADGFDT